MKVSVSYFGQVKAAVGCGSEDVEVAAPCDVGRLIRELAEQHGDTARRMLLGDDGDVQRSLLVVVNDEQIPPGVVRELSDGDRVTVMPPISGGGDGKGGRRCDR